MGSAYTCDLKNLIVEKNDVRIVAIKANHLRSYGNSDVRVVRIIDEKVFFIPTGFSSFFPNMDEFYVESSQLQFIEKSDFSSMKALKSLGFFDNLIATIPEDAFRDLSQLKILSLTKNRLTHLPILLFYNLYDLEELYLRDNEIEFVMSYVFHNNKKLTFINLNGNRISFISPEIVLELPVLRDLKLESNQCIHQHFEVNADTVNETFAIIEKFCQKICKPFFDDRNNCISSLETCRADKKIHLLEFESLN